MLRASNSWPGSQLSEYKGNPRVHDILDRLGLLGPVGDDDPDLEMTADGTEVDGCNTDEASHSGSPARSQRESEISSRSPSEQSSASPHRVPSMQQGTSSKSDMQHDIHTWQPSPMQSQLHPFRPIAQPLSADFVLRTPPKMRSSLGRTLSTAQAVEAASWGTIDYLAPWWQEASQTFQPQPPLNITIATTAPGLNPTTVTSESAMSAVDDPSSYLVDPGVYACDFDME
ncbi:hypothetical protein E4T48_01403 [Aureobasidium sp. EXF-10727]|nr:hypothetical protein E4T48_01403 [Aureobasidium sp. EXF-10727]